MTTPVEIVMDEHGNIIAAKHGAWCSAGTMPPLPKCATCCRPEEHGPVSEASSLAAELRRAEADLASVGPLGKRDHIAYIGALRRRLRRMCICGYLADDAAALADHITGHGEEPTNRK